MLKVKTRIAPSPTGFFHLGTARAALFNFIFARQNKGEFLLRIEDTDIERSDKKFEDDIVSSLKWIGLNWDGPIYHQSERLNLYRSYLTQLLDKSKAFYCFHTPQELESEHKNQLRQKLPLRHVCEHKNLNKGDVEKRLSRSHVIRLATPSRTIIVFKDIIRSEVSFDTSLLGDISLAKDLDTPLYNFAVVVDDYDMGISHVIRGEDHISNTPKQILIQEALGLARPQYAHLPLILGPDRSKLSKRHGATAIREYRAQGYLPEALVNFIALLGWHPEGDREIFSIEELVEEFDLKKVQKAGAVWDQKRLDWIGRQHVQRLGLAELKRAINGYIKEFKPEFDLNLVSDSLVGLIQSRVSKLSDIMGELVWYHSSKYGTELLRWKDSTLESAKDNLKEVLKIIEKISEKDFTTKNLEEKIMPLADKKGRGELLWPLRVALSGKDKSPGPFELAAILGKNETLKRIESALNKLS